MYCIECGNKLEPKFLEHEGMIPFCSKCNDYRFNPFSSAVSMIILNPDETKMLFIKQYGTGKFRLVAGYTNKGESLEHCLFREMGEEIGRVPATYSFNQSRYFARSNTLISNFVCKLTTEDIKPNYEIDSYEWVPISEASEKIMEAKLAYQFVKEYFSKRNN